MEMNLQTANLLEPGSYNLANRNGPLEPTVCFHKQGNFNKVNDLVY